ncbi:dihydrofolate reductase family protein [Microtetraspora niveoalba]|uniref:dihydrofolate reductase family protein n=1 Tax=Microtetraspora niveoalba TaxID=46175 RepID=UPI000829EA58|nr:dihydrofolate reductase family protein [Microtetraspora niveoalba]
MGKLILEMTMSLDGLTAAPKVSVDHPLGEDGERLHGWLGIDGSPVSETDREISAEMFTDTGAFIFGRRTFDVGEGPWGDDGTFGMPCFVVTNRPREQLVKGRTTFTFVTDGIESALEQARAAAGDKDVIVIGGAEVARQYLAAGLIDEVRIHLMPVLLGAGTRLFDSGPRLQLERTRLVESPAVTHLTFRVTGSPQKTR